MTDTTAAAPGAVDRDELARDVIDDELVDRLLEQADAEGAELLGPEGLLTDLTARVLQRALGEELTAHLGYERGDPAGRGRATPASAPAPRRC